jgi:SAM-dependent methyltransferase
MATEFPNTGNNIHMITLLKAFFNLTIVHTEFYGVDDCPLFPTHIKPGNSHFKLHNVLKGLPFQDNEFDFVHMRMMVFYFTPEELSQLLTEVSRVMKPGAYFEMIDSNYTVCRAGPITNKIINTDSKFSRHE